MAIKGFTETQKQYLEGLVSGLRAARQVRRSRPSESAADAELAPPAVPEEAAWAAQERVLLAGRRLSPEEGLKRRQPPEDFWRRMAILAREGRFPQADEVFLYKFHGLFYVSPVEDAFMCRLRLPAGQITAHQLRGVAELAERFGHPALQLTTRSNLQLRGIAAASTLDVLMGLAALGIINRGSGADGVRNIRANATAGVDRRELLDVSALAREAQYRILSDRGLQALPRKFTLAFDGGGAIGAYPETCDLGFRAVRTSGGPGVPAGVYFRILLGGATSHSRYARDAGVLVAPEHCLDVLEEVLELYVEHGDRTNRRRARLLYLLESWGLERFVEELERRLQARLPNAKLLLRWPLAACELPPAPDPAAHLGFHNQKPRGKSYVGVVLPDGHLSVAQARGLASIASDFGSGELRLTPQQNLLVLGLSDTQLHRVKEALSELGLSWSASAIRAGLLACTGSVGCPLAAGDVKQRARELAGHLESRFTFEQPLSIRISGCHHGCAEHGVADIGLLALRGETGARDAEFYQVFVGGEPHESLRFGKEFASGVPAADVPEVVQGVVASYFEQRVGQESFREFVARLSPEGLRGLLPAARLSRFASSAAGAAPERGARP